MGHAGNYLGPLRPSLWEPALTDPAAASTPPTDDLAAAFQIDGWPVRGRIVRLGSAIHEVLSAHDYPEPVAALLGEACVLAALVGSSLKFEGRLLVQAQGDGPVRYVVADYGTDGTLRGFCRFDPAEVAAASEGFSRPGARSLLGQGVMIMTIDRGPDFERTQGITPIEGESLSLCAEHFFEQSEQVPTKVRLAVGAVQGGADAGWRAGGALIQVIAGDAARGSTEEVWERTRALFATLADDELLDPTVGPETLLFRLFHEDGVRLEGARPLRAQCRCSPERIETMLASFTAEDRADMVEPDGKIHVRCEYCGRNYELAPEGQAA